MALPVWVAVGTAALGYLSAQKSRRQAKKLADRQFEYQQQQDALLEEQKQAYRNITFENPYAGVQNQFAENVFEDLTINQQQAQFQARQGQQQRANIMASLRGAAGTTGIASPVVCLILLLLARLRLKRKQLRPCGKSSRKFSTQGPVGGRATS